MAAQCFNAPVMPSSAGIYNNTTDPTNGGATYVGSDSCRACHSDYAAIHAIHGHGHQLNKINGKAPVYPPEGTRAGVPTPPTGYTWNDVAYVIGGYTKGAQFVDLQGYLMTNGRLGVDAQWNLSLPANGTTPGFAPYRADTAAALPYDFTCFRCHTTGPVAQDPAAPRFQDNRPGLIGTWFEEGVQCEACHGPGSNHVPNPSARNLYASNSAATCGKCHGGADSSVIEAEGGYIAHNQQWPELLASGGHKDFSCAYCHDSHASTAYDRSRGIRNECTSCHGGKNMALHDGNVFVRGDYTETLTCQSCHMPFAARTASAATAATIGPNGRMGDTRSHIFRISIEPISYTGLFSPDGSRVVKDAEGQAAVTVDFVCLRCHNGNGAFNLSLARAAEIARGLHQEFP